MAFANLPPMKRLVESLRNSVAGSDGVSLLGGFFFDGRWYVSIVVVVVVKASA